ncbi:ribonuclease R [Tepidicaulis sp. LMO-SS28]|uniref:ribonuclease R n=1 Tax=Tepidicaulis sp. LMO-SS28 TaxID=3447455 RepID=UPI003EE0CDAC
MPSREEILAFIAESGGKAGKREVARAFGISGSARIKLKHILKELMDEGLIKKGQGKKLAEPGTLPPVTVIDITGRNPDGELIAQPHQWEEEEDAPKILVAPPRQKDRHYGATVGVGDRAVARMVPLEDGEEYAYEARIIRRIGKAAETVLGIIREHEQGARLIPVDKKLRIEFDISSRQLGDAREGDLVLAESLPGPRHGLKRAKVKEVFGNAEDQKSISLIAIHAHGIPDEFPEAVIAEAEKAKHATLGEREDLRKIPFITIDPPDARDHDDAVFAAPDDDPKNEGGHIVYVAIADVAAYVRPGSVLDREARKRGNSTYFPDRVVPMLPERISNDLCSLVEGKDRACMAVRMVFDKNGKKIAHRFTRGLLRSVAKLSYQEYQRAVDGHADGKTEALLDDVIMPLWNAYQTMAKARDQRGPLDLDLPEYKVELTETGKVKAIRQAERVEAMRLIEECMIQANVSAAETLEEKRVPLVYRIHDAPSQEKIFALAEFLKSMEISLPKGQRMMPAQFNKILHQAKQGDFIHLVSDMVLRSQSQAVYDPANIGHFGLNLRRYAHFTSPIRRYADLIVHRALVTALRAGKDGLTDDEIKELEVIAEHISFTERRSMLAERETTDRYVASFLQTKVGGDFEGRISGVSRFGLFIRLRDTGADGIVPISHLEGDYFHHDETRQALIGERTHKAYRIGENVRVRLLDAVPVTGGLLFEMLEGGTTMKPAKGVGARTRPGGRGSPKAAKHRRAAGKARKGPQKRR